MPPGECLGHALVANSLCPGQRKAYDVSKSEIQIPISTRRAVSK